MKEEKRYKSPRWKWFIILGILAILIWGIWSVFFSYTKCETWECFNTHLEKCERAEFIGGTTMIFKYTIRGLSEKKCEVEVQLLRGELDNQESMKLNGQKMTCMLPKNIVMTPESDIGNCHGILKEKLQDLIIEKTQNYLVRNLKQINIETINWPQNNQSKKA